MATGSETTARSCSIPATAGAADPTLAAGMRELLASGSGAARACLGSQLGRIAARGSCQEPWSSTSNMTIGFNPIKFRLPQRLNLSLYVNNALGAADLLVHGEKNRRGWGQAISPDATLLFVRGFDPAAQRFRYEVNPRFGSTNPRENINRNPVVVTAQFRVDIGFTRERQLLDAVARSRPHAVGVAIDRSGHSRHEQYAHSAERDVAHHASGRFAQAHSQAGRQHLGAQSHYVVAYDSIWTPVAKYLSGLPEQYDRAAAYDRYRRAREETIDVLMRLAPAVRELLTPRAAADAAEHRDDVARPSIPRRRSFLDGRRREHGSAWPSRADGLERRNDRPVGRRRDDSPLMVAGCWFLATGTGNAS